MATEKRSELAFNIGMIQSSFVAEIYKEILRTFYNGEYKRCYDILYGGLRNVIDSDLKPEEKKILNRKEKIIMARFIKMSRARNKRQYLERKEKFIISLNSYLRVIFYHLRYLGYLPSKKQREMIF